LLLYTDGLVETRTTSLEVGLARLRDAVREGPVELEALCSHVVRRGLVDGPGQDDVAVLAMQLLPLGDRLQLRLPAEPTVLAPLRAILRRWLTQEGASPQECHELLTACGEAATNAIRHAGGPPGAHFELETAHNEYIEICVRDHGHWREPRPGVGGRGIDIMGAYVDDLDIIRTPSGTELRLRRRLGADDREEVAR
jgi:anti-sigma regulatory factor (Ser/Thr protein kinase)